MSKDMNFSLLLDFYAETLGEKQKEIMEDYYYEDLSLAEISENRGITRQGVRDSIKRAQNHLTDIESKLELCDKFNKTKENVNLIEECIIKIKNISDNEDIIKQTDIILNCLKLLN